MRGISRSKQAWENQEPKAPMQKTFDWLQQIYRLVEAGGGHNIDDAIDLLFDHIDEMFLEGRFEECNDLLPKIDLEKMDTYLLVGLLSITFAAKNKLSYHPEFESKIEERLKVLAPDRAHRLIRGFKG